MSSPTITGINPNTGPTTGGTSVLITGTNFTTPATATFGGSGPVTLTVTSGITATAIAPAGTSGSARVVVTTATGSTTQPIFFDFITVSAPTITSVVPNQGPIAGGNAVYINGTNLLYVTSISITTGATTIPVSSFAILGGSQIAAVIPAAPDAAAGAATINVTNGAGTATGSYTYDTSPISLPTVTAVSPTHGPALGGNTVVLTGTGFTYATEVDFGAGNPSPLFTIEGDTSITAQAPPGTGTVTVTVTSAAGVGTVGALYTYDTALLPTITSLTPVSGPMTGGGTVTISGTNLNLVTGVSVGGSAAPMFTILSPVALNVVMPAATVPGAVNVTVSDGTYTSAPATYTYVAGPVPTSITPTAGLITGGTPFAIVGTGFTGTSSVLFGTTPAPPASLSVNADGTEIDGVTPAHSISTVAVTITAPGGTDSSTSFSFQPPPIIESMTPNEGPVGGGTTVTINGAGFLNATQVYFGSTAATSFTFTSDNLITAVSPAGTGAVAVTVNTPAAFSNGALFQYVVAPTLTSISPTGGSIDGNNNVTLNGSGFTGATNVFFGATPATFTFLGDTVLSAVAPPTGVPGPVSVTVQNAGGTSAGQTYTYS